MTKPEWCPQDVWDDAGLALLSVHLREAVAAAIMAAKAEEREACALVASGGAEGFNFEKAWSDMDDASAGYANARLDIAAAIRNRDTV